MKKFMKTMIISAAIFPLFILPIMCCCLGETADASITVLSSHQLMEMDKAGT